MSLDLVLVTGGSRGIGAALARSWPRPPARVVVLSRSAPVEPVGEALSRRVDLSTREGIEAAASVIAEEVDRLPDAGHVVLVHNAAAVDPVGFAGRLPIDEVTSQALLNHVAPITLGNAFLAAVDDHPGRRILVQLTSGAARSVYPGSSGYGPSKAAVDHWVRHVGQEQRVLAERGSHRPVEVLAIAPGVVATAMQERLRSTDEADFPAVERFRRLHEDGALADPDDVAQRLWRLVLDGGWDTGSVLDLRDTA